MYNSYKFRIYPTDEQKQKLAQMFGCARFVYNNSLGFKKELYSQSKESISCFDLIKRMKELKSEFLWLKDCHSQVLQQSLINLDKAFKNFFSKRAKFPKFKSRNSKQSIRFPQSVALVDNNLKFPKLGLIETVLHRKIEGSIKSATVTKDACNHYYASILTETGEILPEQSFQGKIIGIDLGLKDFAVTSEGNSYEAQKEYRELEQKLKINSRRHAKKTKASKNREKARIRLARVHKKISNKRFDFSHKLSRQLVNENQVIAVETLKVANMVKNRKLSKSISDAGWSSFVTMLDYKTAREGKVLIKVDSFFPSSKICNNCKSKKDELNLSEREWQCKNCNSLNNRDLNAAKNIRDEAFRILKTTAGTAELVCGEDVRCYVSCEAKTGTVFCEAERVQLQRN